MEKENKENNENNNKNKNEKKTYSKILREKYINLFCKIFEPFQKNYFKISTLEFSKRFEHEIYIRYFWTKHGFYCYQCKNCINYFEKNGENLFKKHYINEQSLKENIRFMSLLTKEELVKDTQEYLETLQFRQRIENKMKLTSNPESIVDGMFTCHKCGSKKTTYFCLQTRGADEPMTNFHTCLNCGKNWKS